MSEYDDDFYTSYAKYLDDPKVRAVHDFALKTLCSSVDFDRVVDLGCGLKEFMLNRGAKEYLGIDTKAPNPELRDDYRNPHKETVRAIRQFQPRSFISLFSSEITAGEMFNWVGLYRQMFTDFPTINFGLVSGFYYRGLSGKERVTEPNDLVSWQTTMPLGLLETDDDPFTEISRLTLPCPSQLFGPDPIEVWRLFRRKETQ